MAIDEKALDYFCASSTLLKVGVPAVLTLYKIATLCCRNNNMGERLLMLEAILSIEIEFESLRERVGLIPAVNCKTL